MGLGRGGEKEEEEEEFQEEHGGPACYDDWLGTWLSPLLAELDCILYFSR